MLLLYLGLSIACGLLLNLRNLNIFNGKRNRSSSVNVRVSKRDEDENAAKRKGTHNRTGSINSRKKPAEPKIAASYLSICFRSPLAPMFFPFRGSSSRFL
ncbi:uncharacterized protein [Blastocystis hominis]|uniref:Uncharacterized protein n=1 Tax=Blastocystis hominis TaxID=12968 RepID=D8M9F8_BLAHO|nr:uncharacterized protein [Blastocystis hominis]CBK24697.2 unnamed protein product [Blastocystis hominis]|eukprot:XP_012898745.1 uncharacterized protein [Blastocystis hominis]